MAFNGQVYLKFGISSKNKQNIILNSFLYRLQKNNFNNFVLENYFFESACPRSCAKSLILCAEGDLHPLSLYDGKVVRYKFRLKCGELL